MTVKKDRYLEQLKKQYDELNYRWNVERSRLEAKTQHHSAEARQRLEKELEELDRLRKKMKEKMIDLEVAGENAWVDFKDDAGGAAAGEPETSKGFTIVPQCPYVAAQFRKHPDWADVRAEIES